MSTIRQSLNAHSKIAVNPLTHTILDSKYRDNNISKGILALEERTYRETKGNGKIQKGNGKEIMGKSNEKEGQSSWSKTLWVAYSVKVSLWL